MFHFSVLNQRSHISITTAFDARLRLASLRNTPCGAKSFSLHITSPVKLYYSAVVEITRYYAKRNAYIIFVIRLRYIFIWNRREMARALRRGGDAAFSPGGVKVAHCLLSPLFVSVVFYIILYYIIRRLLLLNVLKHNALNSDTISLEDYGEAGWKVPRGACILANFAAAQLI